MTTTFSLPITVPMKTLKKLGSLLLAMQCLGVSTIFLVPASARGQAGSSRLFEANLPKNQVVATLSVGSSPVALVVSKKGDFVYVSNISSNTISVIETSTNTVTKTLSTNAPFGLAITPDGNTLYVANQLSPGTVSVLSTGTGSVIQTLAVGNYPTGVAITPNGQQVYVTNNADGTVSVIDTATNQVLPNPINVSGAPYAAVFLPDGKEAYIANQAGSSFLSLIDTATEGVLSSTVAAGEIFFSNGLAISPNGTNLYVSDEWNYIDVVNTVSKRLIREMLFGPISGYAASAAVAVTPSGTYAYAPIFFNSANSANSDVGNTVVTLDTTTGKVVGKPITVGNYPNAIAIAPNGRHAYVSNRNDNTVSVIDVSLQ
jgi:YVTN family beta-propeller protein